MCISARASTSAECCHTPWESSHPLRYSMGTRPSSETTPNHLHLLQIVPIAFLHRNVDAACIRSLAPLRLPLSISGRHRIDLGSSDPTVRRRTLRSTAP